MVDFWEFEYFLNIKDLLSLIIFPLSYGTINKRNNAATFTPFVK